MGSARDEARRVLSQAVAMDKEGKKDDADEQFRRAVALNPSFSDAYERYSLFLYARKRFDAGLALMNKAISNIPGRRELKAYKAMHLYRLNKFLEAFKLFEQAAGAGDLKERYEVQVVYAQSARVVGRSDHVIKGLTAYLKHRPEALAKQDFLFHTQLGEALIRTGKVKAGGKHLRDVLMKKRNYRPAHIARAEYLLRRRICGKAIDVYNILTKGNYDKDDQRLRVYLAEAYVCKRDYANAFATAGKFLSTNQKLVDTLVANPKSGDVLPIDIAQVKTALLLRGDSAMQLNKFGDAEDGYRQALKVYQDSPKVMLKVARSLYAQKKYADVMTLLSGELAKAVPDSDLLIMAVRCSIRLKKEAEFLALAERLLKLPNVTKTHFYYAGIAYSSAGKYERATELLEKADTSKAKVAKELVRAYTYQAYRIKTKGGSDKLILVRLKKAVEYGPDNADAHRNLAMHYLAEDQGQEALPHATFFVKAQPKDVMANRLMGRTLSLVGKYKEAIQHLNFAFENFQGSNSEKAKILIDTGVSRMQSGEVDAAMKDFQSARKLGKGDARIIRTVKRNIARGYLARGKYYLDQKPPQTQRAWKELSAALKASSALVAMERSVVQTMVAFGAIATGRTKQAKQLITRQRVQLVTSLNAPYNKIGFPLLMAYADAFSRVPRQVQRAASKIARLAQQVPPPASTKLQQLAGALHEKLAVRFFNGGNAKAAIANLNLARNLAKSFTASMRHNMAVANYSSGNKGAAISALNSATRSIPLALCNIGVHHENSAAMQKAYSFFSKCQKRGVKTFPNLRGILQIKEAIFGKPPG